MNKFDSHVHFDCKKDKPYSDIRERLRKNNIESCVLILNSTQEQEIFLENLEVIKKENLVYTIAGLLDIHKSENLVFFEQCKQNGIMPAVKLHPRLNNITRSDFENILIML